MMKALIIEDETAAARNLAAILRQTAPEVEIVATLESVAESIEWLRANPEPELLFMDIHLADGDSFRIFDAVEITAPVRNAMIRQRLLFICRRIGGKPGLCKRDVD